MIARMFQDPRAVLLTLALLAVGGTAGFVTRATREDPESRIRWGYVTTDLPGAEPSEVETLVSEPIERAVREAGSVRSVESSSLAGVSLVFIRLTDEVTDVRQCWLRIQDKLSQVTDQLPPEASNPTLVDERRWGSDTTVIALTERSGAGTSPSVLARWAKELDNRLNFVPGTRFTEVFGLPLEEILVEVDESFIASTKLTARAVAGRIRSRDSGVSDATSRSSDNRMPVSLTGDITNLDAIRNIILANEGETNEYATPRQMRLGDVATVTRSERHPHQESVTVQNQNAVVIATRMDDSYGIDAWTKAQDEVLADFAARLPANLSLSVIFNQKHYTDERASNLYQSLGLGMLLVVVVVCLMMGWRATLPICAALPLSLGIVFLVMIPFGISLHQMSIAGLILALGMLIDNPIIVVDEIQNRLDRGENKTKALQGTVQHLSPALLGSNLTTVLGFIPIILIGGPTGEFMEQLGWCVIVSLLGSLVLSLSIVPVLAIACLRPNARTEVAAGASPQSSYARMRFKFQQWTKNVSMWLINLCLRQPIAVILLSSVIPALGFVASGSLKEQFFPAAERDHFHFSIRLPTHSTVDRTEAVAAKAIEMIMRYPEVKDVAMFVGRSAPKLHYSMVSMEDNRQNFAQGLVQLNTPSVPLELVHAIQKDLDDELREAQCVVKLIEQGPPAPAPIEFRIYGPSLPTLYDLGQEAQSLLMQIPGVVHTRTSLDAGGPSVDIDFSQTEVEQLGLVDETISGQIMDYIDGVVESSLSEEIEEIPIRIRLRQGHQSRVDRILSLPIIANQPLRQMTTVDSIAKMSIEQQVFSIYRRNSTRCNIVYAYTRAGMLPIEIEQAFKESMIQSGFQLPAGYQSDFGGISAERNSAVGNLVSYSSIVLVMMVAVLVLTFGSFRMATIIVLVALLSVGIGLASLWLFNYPIGIVAIIGLAGLLGLAVNDSIVVLRECQISEQSSDSIAKSIYGSTRHVLATSVTTVAGVLPLIMQGGDFWPPMMVVIAGGIVGATLIALGFTPACYLLLRPKNTRPQAFSNEVL